MLTEYLLRILLVIYKLILAQGFEAKSTCTTPNNETGMCIPMFDCLPIMKGIATLEPAALNFSRDSQCGCTKTGGPMVCCGSDSTYTVKTRRPTPMPLMDPKRLLPNRRICGYQARDDRYDVRSIDTHIDEYPWIGILLYDGTQVVECAGTLINRRYVLTLAECAIYRGFRGNLTHVRLGEYDVTHNGLDCVANPDYPECSEDPVDYKVEEIIVHEKFNKDDFFADDNVALVRLQKEVTYTDYIRPICLPIDDVQQAQLEDRIYASGWGLAETSERINEYAKIKRNLNGKVISMDACKKEFSSSPRIKITENMICIKDDTGAPCVGDTGGPFMKQNRIQWHLEGMYSFGTNTHRCVPGVVSVGVRVSKYTDWILRQLRP